MAIVTSKYCCITVQQMMDNIVGANTPNGIVLETYGFMDALMSNANTANTEVIRTESAAGKARPTALTNRRVEVEFATRTCESTATSAAGLCDSQTNADDDLSYDAVYVTQVRSNGFSLSKEEFRDLCENPSDRQARRIVNKINDLKRDINADLITSYIAGLGNYFSEPPPAVPVDSGAAPKTLFLFDASGRTNGQAFMPMQRDYRRSNWRGTPIVVGGNLSWTWAQSRPYFVGNEDGKDTTLAPVPFNWFGDFQVDQVFGDGLEHLLQWAPGVTRMVEWYQYEGIYEEIKEDYQETKLTVDGFTVDFTVRYNECTKVWDLSFTKYFDLWKIPDEAFSTDCGQFSNGCLQWLADCGDIDCTYLKL